MSLVIDATDVTEFARLMEQAPPKLRAELAKRTHNLLVAGAGFMRRFAPRLTGRLAGSISVINSGSFAGGESGSYGTSLFYAAQRNYGGPIRAKNAPYLVFQVAGRWVRTKQVYQAGAHFLEKSIEALKPLIEREYRYAVEAVFGGLR